MAASAAPTAPRASPRRPDPGRDGFPKGIAAPRPRTERRLSLSASFRFRVCCYRLSRTFGAAPAEKQLLIGETRRDAGGTGRQTPLFMHSLYSRAVRRA